MNIKKCLITIVSAILITAVMHAQEASEDLTAEQHQLAQRKAELDAREKALNKREKKLAEKERATANSTLRSREKGKAKAKHQQTIAQSQEEQAKAARAEKKLHEPFFQRLDEAFLEQLGTPAYTPPEPERAVHASYSAGTVRFSTVSVGRLADQWNTDHWGSGPALFLSFDAGNLRGTGWPGMERQQGSDLRLGKLFR